MWQEEFYSDPQDSRLPALLKSLSLNVGGTNEMRGFYPLD